MKEVDAHDIDTSVKLDGYERDRRQQMAEVGAPPASQPPPPNNEDNEGNNVDNNDNDNNDEQEQEPEPSLDDEEEEDDNNEDNTDSANKSRTVPWVRPSKALAHGRAKCGSVGVHNVRKNKLSESDQRADR